MNNIFAFHGADHKSGCTMIALSMAELIARMNQDTQVLFAALNGRASLEYISGENISITDLKMQLSSGIGIDKSMLKSSGKLENLYVVSGVEAEEQARYFFPDMATNFMESVYNQFGVVIIDTGSEMDNGLALGGLSSAGQKYLVIKQCESDLKRVEKMHALREQLGIQFDYYIVNQFVEDDPYTVNYIGERLGVNKEKMKKIVKSPHGRQAEMEHKTLLAFDRDKYVKDVRAITNEIGISMHVKESAPRRKYIWKNFI